MLLFRVGSTPGVKENLCLYVFLLYLARVVNTPAPLGMPLRTRQPLTAVQCLLLR